MRVHDLIQEQQFTNLSGLPTDEKKRLRLEYNEVLYKALNDKGIKFKKKKVRDLLNDQEIPDYEVAAVVGTRYANYEKSGFATGEDGKDVTHNGTLAAAVKWLSDSTDSE